MRPVKVFVTFENIKMKKAAYSEYKRKKCCECCYSKPILKIFIHDHRLYFSKANEPLNLNFLNLPISKLGRCIRGFLALFITLLLLIAIAVGYVFMSQYVYNTFTSVYPSNVNCEDYLVVYPGATTQEKLAIQEEYNFVEIGDKYKGAV